MINRPIRTPLCACGCGLPVTKYRGVYKKYSHGHNKATLGIKHSAEIRANMSKSKLGNSCHLGFKHSNEIRKRISNRVKLNTKRGAEHYRWVGGIHITPKGYVSVLMPEHPFANSSGRINEERLVMEKYLGRYLLPNETVHHKNEIKNDNLISNLEIMGRVEHRQHHANKEWKDGKHDNNRNKHTRVSIP
jgi:hypothetical protein